jgi:hypothetical protein
MEGDDENVPSIRKTELLNNKFNCSIEANANIRVFLLII